MSEEYELGLAMAEDYEDIVSLVLEVPRNDKGLNKKAPTNVFKVREKVLDWMVHHNTFVYRDEDNKIQGVMLIAYDSPWWSDKGFIYNAVLYVRPEHRSFGLLKTFIEAGTEYGEIIGHPFAVSFTFVERIDVKEKLIKKLGFKKVGSMFTLPE